MSPETSDFELLAMRVIHHARLDPRGRVGGVHSFALGLRQVFTDVEFTTPSTPSLEKLATPETLVICDNHSVTDWPRGYPVVGFRHGVAAEKVRLTRNWTDTKLALGQWRAAHRKGVIWVACAGWIADASQRFYGSRTDHVVYHPIDTERFDGRLDNVGSRLILHDARGAHKGQHLIPVLQKTFPDWHFEGLNCTPSEVPERMRTAAGFIHLSRYEGNSIVCCEAMAMNLPCLFTNVGLMRDPALNLDVSIIDATRSFSDSAYLIASVSSFLHEISTGTRQPRNWILENATLTQVRHRWRAIADEWQEQMRRLTPTARIAPSAR
jgi:hypothetical protein